MKTVINSLIIIIFLQINNYCQQWVSTSTGFNQQVIDVKFFNADFGFVLLDGDNNTSTPHRIMKTTNRGTSWQNVYNVTPSLTDECAIEMIDQYTGFLYYDDKIVKTTNGFNSTPTVVYNMPSHASFYRIKFVNEYTGYALFNSPYSGYGVSVYKTVDAGNNWSVTSVNRQLQGNTLPELRDITYYPSDPNTIFIAGTINNLSNYYGFVWRSNDGFSNYFELVPLDVPTGSASYLAFVPGTSNVVFLAGERGIYKSTGGNFNNIGSTPGGLNYQFGLCFSDINRGFYKDGFCLYYSSNSGSNWVVEQCNIDLGFSRLNSFQDAAMTGAPAGNFWLRKFPININAIKDWQTSFNISGSLDNIDGGSPINFTTPQNNIFVRGGTSNIYIPKFIVSGNDTIERFYYWGGNANANMGSTPYFEKSGNINADFKSKLLATEQSALANANQIKAIKDTNGVTNLLYESMEGIFFTRTRPDGNFKTEEIVSGTEGSLESGYATFKNKNPYLAEINGISSSVHPERNMIACWERREGSNIKILVAYRKLDPLSRPEWGIENTITIENAPAGFQCFPKIMVSSIYPDDHRLITFLRPVPNSNNVRLVARFISPLNPSPQELEIIPASDIREYSISGLPSQPYAPNFMAHITYRINQEVYYKRSFIGWDGAGARTYDIDLPNRISNNDGNMWRASMDISLKNTSTTAGVYNMQPVVTYQGRKSIRIVKDNFDGSTSIIETDAYPIVVKERLSSGNWSTGNIIYNSYSSLQQTPNIVGSKLTNACILNFTRIEGGVTKTLQVVPRWNSGQINTHSCVPNSFVGVDSKFRKGSIINSSSTIDTMMTLSAQGSLFKIDRQRFTITDNTGIEEDGFEFVNGVVVNDNVKYSFNLGNIIVNSKEIAFTNELDTAVESSGELNESMQSLPFVLSNDDTLIIGRNASYIPETPEANFSEIEYWVNLINKTSGRVHKLLAHDTLQVNDTIQLEYLEGYIISDIPEGTDSFYVALEIDTIDADGYGIGGGEGDGDGGMSGSGDNLGFKRKIFWEKENLESVNNSLPTVFNLYQNFPNPFNPVTLIKYDLPKDVNVTLKIYDLLGREVETLVNNDFRSAGRYEMNWNASKYASGVYIYRLQAGDYVKTKKMVLVK